MKPSILITGGSGLLALNWAMTMRASHAVVLGRHEREVELAGIETRPLDLESVDQLVRTLEILQPQVVVHTAGMTNVTRCEGDPGLAHHVNVELAGNVALACARSGTRLIHVSTDHLFSGTEALLDEGHPTAPRNVYGRTKAEAELRVLEACPQSLVMRTNFYGWGPSYRHSFSDVVIDGLRTGGQLTLYTDVFYTPILIEEAVRAAHDLIEAGADGIYHVVGDERVSKYEFGLAIAREFEFDSSIIKVGRLADEVSSVQRPSDMSLSNQKTCSLLGRKLGRVAPHIARLHEQELNGFAREMQSL